MSTYYLRALTWLALLCAVCSLTSCKPKKTTTPDVNKPGPAPVKVQTDTVKPDVNTVTPAPVTAKAGSDVLVTVNGVDITEKQLDELLKPHLDRMAKQGANLPPALLAQQMKLLKDQALQGMITMQLIDEEVKKANIVVTDNEVTSEITRMAALQKPPVTLEELKATMEAYGASYEELKNQIQTTLGLQKLVAQKYPAEVKVTEDDAKAYYEQNKSRWPEEVRASHILIKPDLSDPNTDPNQAEALAKAKAEDLLKQVKGGADFAALAKENSACPSASAGGDLNFFPRTGRGSMVPEFSNAAFALKVGGISDVVKTEHGYHIIKVTDRKDTPSFDQVKESIMKELGNTKMSAVAKKYIEELKSGAKIVYPPGKEPKPAAAPAIPGGAVPQ
jgi:parvulin-like peptidyl-prolyl isomerase